VKRALVAALLIRSAVAHADDPHVALAKAQLAAQCKAIAHDDMPALRATFTAGARIELPGTDPAAPADAEWGFPAPEKCAVGKTQIGWANGWGWVAAELRITTRWYAEPADAGDPNPQPTTATYHWLAVVVPDGGGVKTRALHIARAFEDKSLYDDDPAPAAKSPGPLATLATTPSAIAAQLAGDTAVTIFGTGPDEAGLGHAAAVKLVGGWKKIQLAPIDAAEEIIDGDLGIAFVPMQMRLKGKPKSYDLRALLIARKVGSGWQVVALAYGGRGSD
jgi:hypothetical protein